MADEAKDMLGVLATLQVYNPPPTPVLMFEPDGTTVITNVALDKIVFQREDGTRIGFGDLLNELAFAAQERKRKGQ